MNLAHLFQHAYGPLEEHMNAPAGLVCAHSVPLATQSRSSSSSQSFSEELFRCSIGRDFASRNLVKELHQMSQATTHQHFLHHSQIHSSLAESLHQLHQETRASLAPSAAGWHGFDDIKTLEGLGGSYLWTENPLQPARITFQFDPGHVGSQGTYNIMSGLFIIEQGTFYSVPNNPAIGWASISLAPNTMATPRPFIVAGMFTDSNWKIEILLLNKVGASGPIQPPFSVLRML